MGGLPPKPRPCPLNAGPSTSKRSIESQVVVDAGQIIVLGGLVKDEFIENKSKVPLLGDIPYIGALFRSESREKRELVGAFATREAPAHLPLAALDQPEPRAPATHHRAAVP